MHLAEVVDNVGIISLDPYISEGHISSINALEQICDNLLKQGIDLCLLDMRDVQTVPSVFLATIVTLQNKLNTTGGRLALLNPANYVQKLLNITVVNELIEAFDNKMQAIYSLKKAKKDEYESLMQKMNSTDLIQRFEAAKKLARMGEEKAFNYIVDSLSSENDNERFQATLCLTAIGGERVVNPLIRALKDNFYKVRCFAAEALGNLRSNAALNPLKEVIRFDHNRNVVAKASEAIDKIVHSTGNKVTTG